MRKFLTGLGAIALVLAPTMASAANPAAKLSVAPAAARASAKEGDSKLLGFGLITIVVIAAVVVAVVLIADDNSDSP